MLVAHVWGTYSVGETEKEPGESVEKNEVSGLCVILYVEEYVNMWRTTSGSTKTEKINPQLDDTCWMLYFLGSVLYFLLILCRLILSPKTWEIFLTGHI